MSNNITTEEALLLQNLYAITKDEELKCLLCYALTCFHNKTSLEPLALKAAAINREHDEVSLEEASDFSFRTCVVCGLSKNVKREFKDPQSHMCIACLREINLGENEA